MERRIGGERCQSPVFHWSAVEITTVRVEETNVRWPRAVTNSIYLGRYLQRAIPFDQFTT